VNVKAPDSTKIEVSVPGYENGQDSFPVEEKRGQLRTVRLVPKDAAKLTKTLMEITIVNQFDGSKVQNAKVTVGRDSQVTDRDGLVNLVLLPGIHPINVTANGYHKDQTRITVPEFDVTGSNAAERREITIRPQGALGEEMQGWELEDGTAALIIEVLDAQSGKPIQGATVRFDDGDTFATEKDGRLRKSVPAPKSWKIEVAAPGYRSGQDSFTVEEKRGQIRTVRLAPVDAAKVDKVLLAITIMDMGDGSFVQNAKVTVGRASGITDAKGLVKLRVLPGIHAFSANAKGYVKESRPLDVPESKEKQEMLIAIRPSGGADIFVRVLRSGSRVPINKASVKLSSQYEYTNSNGEARFLKMPFGEHSLVVQADGYKKQLKLINHSKQSPASDFTEIELEPN
jgi:hypothetical protein